jgi:hypothetical protein
MEIHTATDARHTAHVGITMKTIFRQVKLLDHDIFTGTQIDKKI